MSLTRQSTLGAEEELSVRSLALGLPSRWRLAAHRHPWPQFLYATSGVLTITTERARGSAQWVVPSHRAVWIPGGVEHHLETTGAVRLRTLYLHPELVPTLPQECCVLGVTPLLRELVLETVARGMLRATIPEDWRLAQVLVDQLERTREVPLDLVWPRDPRARRVADAVKSDLSVDVPLALLARESGASVRTLERLFQAETGKTFSRWRQQARLLHALERLASGDSVTTTAVAVGYDSTSAFVSTFKRTLGTTPGAYFRASIKNTPAST